MTKEAVTKLFVGAGLAMIAGAVLAVASVWIAIANDVFVMNRSDIVGLRGSALGRASLGLGIVGCVDDPAARHDPGASRRSALAEAVALRARSQARLTPAEPRSPAIG